MVVAATLPNSGDDSITVFEPVAMQVLRSIHVPGAPDQPGVSVAPDAVVVSPDGAQLYVAGRNNNTVYALDVVTGSIRASFNTVSNGGACGPMGLALTADGGRLYVEGSTCSIATVLDTSTHGHIGLIANVPNVAEGGKVAVSSAASRAYFGDNGTVIPGGGLQVLDTSTNTLQSPFQGSPFFGVAVDADGSHLWFAGGSTIEFRMIVGCCSSSVQPLGSALRGVAAARNGSDTVAIADGANTLWIVTFDGESFNSTSVTVGNTPFGTAVSPTASLAYVTNQTDNTLSIVDTVADAVVATLPVGASPTDIGLTPYAPPGT
jgi:YVTN family beta-propeller protein